MLPVVKVLLKHLRNTSVSDDGLDAGQNITVLKKLNKMKYKKMLNLYYFS